MVKVFLYGSPDDTFMLFVYLASWDIIEITIENLGSLRNPVVKGKSAFVAPP